MRKPTASAEPASSAGDDTAVEVVTAAAPAPSSATGPAAAEQDAEQPSAGGSYVRQADGSLKRMEFTEESPIGGANGTAPADQKSGD